MDDIRDSYSRLKKKFKHRLTGSKNKPDGTESDASGERVSSTSSLPQPEPRIVAGGGSNRSGDKANADGQQVRPTDRAPNDRQRGAGDVGEVERIHLSPSTPLVPRSGKPNSMWTLLFQWLLLIVRCFIQKTQPSLQSPIMCRKISVPAGALDQVLPQMSTNRTGSPLRTAQPKHSSAESETLRMPFLRSNLP